MRATWQICTDENGSYDRVILMMRHGDHGQVWAAWVYSSQRMQSDRLAEFYPSPLDPYMRCEVASRSVAEQALESISGSDGVALAEQMLRKGLETVRQDSTAKGVEPPPEDWQPSEEAESAEDGDGSSYGDPG